MVIYKNSLYRIEQRLLNDSLWFVKLTGKFTKCGQTEKVFLKVISTLQKLKGISEDPIFLLYEVLELIKPQIFGK